LRLVNFELNSFSEGITLLIFIFFNSILGRMSIFRPGVSFDVNFNFLISVFQVGTVVAAEQPASDVSSVVVLAVFLVPETLMVLHILSR